MRPVPKVWEGIKAGALAKVKKAGAVAGFLIALAVKMKAMGARHYRRLLHTTPKAHLLTMLRRPTL